MQNSLRDHLILGSGLGALLLALAGGPVAAEENLSPPAPIREFRAAWITTVANIDWPSKPGLPVAQQQAELISLLDRTAQHHFNAVCFQVRSVSDAMYASSIEPWSEYLTGVQGRAPVPYYDPLALAVMEAHKRGLALHAWFNPFRAGHPQAKSPPAANHISRTVPELVRRYGDQIWLDPGEPPVQARVLAVMLDVVKRYDIDGVVMDDYFYPYPQKNHLGLPLDFPDNASWKRYGAGTGLTRADWRRENINRFVRRASQSIKAAKPWVQFGISPFGIWRPKNPPTVMGMDAYAQLYADARKWLGEGWVDYLAPQLYWPISPPEHSFPALLDWWRAQNLRHRHVWPALADAYTGGKFATPEIAGQLRIIRQKEDPGAVHYHLRSLLENPPLLAGVSAQYAQPALIPASPWINATPPPAPTRLAVHTDSSSAQVEWQASAFRSSGWWVLQTYADGAWATQILPAQSLAARVDGRHLEAVAVRAADRLGNLSPPQIWTPKRYAPPPAGRGIKNEPVRGVQQ
jgi:uncharacterized lipoprotein YddW (UPF0748 family)